LHIIDPTEPEPTPPPDDPPPDPHKTETEQGTEPTQPEGT
jgi:hypothetical protein